MKITGESGRERMEESEKECKLLRRGKHVYIHLDCHAGCIKMGNEEGGYRKELYT